MQVRFFFREREKERESSLYFQLAEIYMFYFSFQRKVQVVDTALIIEHVLYVKLI